GPITDKWTRPVRSAAREFLRKNGSRARHPQPTGELLTALKAVEPVKKQAASPPAAARPEEKPVPPSEFPVKESPQKQSDAPPKQSASAPAPESQNNDYLPPWMTPKTEQARFASKSEGARFDKPSDERNRDVAGAPSNSDDAPKRSFH